MGGPASNAPSGGPIRLTVTLVALLWIFVAESASASPLFEDTSLLDATLEGPLSTLIKNKRERTWTDFKLHVGDTTHTIQVRVRGKSRVQYCAFPPLRLEFTPEASAGTLFERQQRLKLVTHCNSDKRADVNVLEEYAAYRMFSQLSKNAYATRLMMLRYRDTEASPSSDPTHYAFVIESHREAARRLRGKIARQPTVSLAKLDREQAAHVFLFNYMIGNTDYSLISSRGEDYCCHNGNIVERDGQLTLLPYDFDLSGLVNARYARPKKALRIKDVTQRRYVGYCLPENAMRSALRSIKKRKPQILAQLTDLPGLSEKQIALKTAYLEEFYAEASSESRLLRSLASYCL